MYISDNECVNTLLPEDFGTFTFLYGLAMTYNLNCSSNKVPWNACCGCGLGGCLYFGDQ